jgi:hypothetical protein
VVPRAANLVIDDEPVSERPVVVGTMRADGENFGPAANEENLLLPHASDELPAVWKFGKRNSLGQIRARWPGLVFRHSDLLRCQTQQDVDRASKATEFQRTPAQDGDRITTASRNN